jgi:hypothetical protein
MIYIYMYDTASSVTNVPSLDLENSLSIYRHHFNILHIHILVHPPPSVISYTSFTS